MKSVILEEINRFKFLSNYDNSKTSVENEVNLTEGVPGEALIKALETDRQFASTLRDELESMRNLGLQTRDLKDLKTSEEIIDAIKGGKLAPAELGRVNWELLKNTTDAKLAETLSKDIAANKSFGSKVGGKTKSEFINYMKDNKIPEKKANLLWKSYQANIKELETAKSVEDIKSSFKDIEDVKDVKDIKNDKNIVKDVENVKDVDKDLKIADEVKAEENLKNAEKLGNEESDVLSQIKDAEAEAKLRENREYLESLKDSKPNVVLDWFRRSKLIGWAKKLVSWKTLLILGAIGGAGYFVWYKWFKDKGFKLVCPDGEEENTVTGKCERVRGGGNKDIDPNDPDIINETDPSKFTECSGIYKLGCKGNDISKVQDCLGIEVTGLLGKRTEDALYKRINKRTFTKDDISNICTFKGPNIASIS